MSQRKTLTERQIQVLQWIADGSPTVAEEEAQSRRISAGALRNRGLVETSGRGASWAASITEAGREYLARAKAPGAPLPRRANVLVTEQLVADVTAAGGTLVIENASRGWGEDGVDWERRVELAERHNKVRAGKRLVARWMNGRRDLQIELIEAPDGAIFAAAPVTVPSRVARYHPLVVQFRDRKERHEVSRGILPRAMRILHAIVVESEGRGYKVGLVADRRDLDRRGPAWSGEKDGHFTIATGDFALTLRLHEEGINRTWTPPTKWELQEWEQRPWTKPKPFTHETGGTGRLVISVVAPNFGRGWTSQWADRKSWALEDKVGEILAELEVRAVEDRQRREIAAREEEQRRLRWDDELQRARDRYSEHARGEALAKQLELWRTAEDIRAFCEAIEQRHADDDEAMAWAAWARAHADRIDPLSEPPRAPALPVDQHDYQLTEFIKDWSSSPGGRRAVW